jgi:small-conductance mechanosensitive channel
MHAFDVGRLLESFSAKQGWLELLVLGGAVLAAWLVSAALRQRIPDGLQPGLAKIGAGSAHRLFLPVLLLAFTWIARVGLAKFQPTPVLSLAIPLVFAFAAIRLAVYLLRHSMAHPTLLKSSERFIVLLVWGVIALHITGLLAEMAAALDEISIPLGTKKISLLLVVQGLFSVAVTLFFALGLSGLAESRLMRAEALNLSSRVVLSKILRALALTLAVLIALPLVGIDLTVLSVFSGALGVGLGFGLQKIASNYVSGFIILLDRSIRLGDLITVDNKSGVVESIKSRYTVIKSLDGTESIIPNDTLITSTVVNHSYTDPTVSMKVGATISYDSDLDLACRLLQQLAENNPRVLREPAPAVQVKALADNGIELELIVWIRDPEQGQGALRSELLRGAWRAFVEHNITVPYPQREVRVVSGVSPVAGADSELRVK